MRIPFHALGFHRGVPFLVRLDWLHGLVDERGCAFRCGLCLGDIALTVFLGTGGNSMSSSIARSSGVFHGAQLALRFR